MSVIDSVNILQRSHIDSSLHDKGGKACQAQVPNFICKPHFFARDGKSSYTFPELEFSVVSPKIDHLWPCLIIFDQKDGQMWSKKMVNNGQYGQNMMACVHDKAL
jgi:hypothetical protein